MLANIFLSGEGNPQLDTTIKIFLSLYVFCLSFLIIIEIFGFKFDIVGVNPVLRANFHESGFILAVMRDDFS